MTIRFAILGHPVKHSHSPKFHNTIFRRLGLKDYRYEFYDCSSKNLSKAIDKIRKGEYQGYSVTIPLKEAVVRYLDELSPIAKKIGAVNTIIRQENGTLFGYNTDYEGFRKAMEESGVELRITNYALREKIRDSLFDIRSALVLGTGGASKAVTAVLLDQGWKVTVGTRGKGKELRITNYELREYKELNPSDNYRFIVNTTPLGMSPDVDKSPLINSAWFTSDRVYADVIYTPKMTKFLKLAKKARAKIITGDRMFYFQAMAQSRYFCH